MTLSHFERRWTTVYPFYFNNLCTKLVWLLLWQPVLLGIYLKLGRGVTGIVTREQMIWLIVEAHLWGVVVGVLILGIPLMVLRTPVIVGWFREEK